MPNPTDRSSFSVGPFGSWHTKMAAGALVIAIAVGLWLSVQWSGHAPRDLPLIRAEMGPEKVRPTNEGGLMTPNKDIQVYGLIDGEVRPAEPEMLRPGPEAPLPPTL